MSIDNHRDMSVAEIRETQFALQENLPGRGLQQVDPAHHVGYSLGLVINNHCNLVGVYPVFATDDEIADSVQDVLFLVTLNPIAESDRSGIGS